jgi:hypothetical protein
LLENYTNALKLAGFRMHRVIAPLRSPINFHPYSLEELQKEFAARLTAGAGSISATVAGVLRLPGVWSLAVSVAERFDNRPGRLYSFVADRM